jgi:hypothetical protein
MKKIEWVVKIFWVIKLGLGIAILVLVLLHMLGIIKLQDLLFWWL